MSLDNNRHLEPPDIWEYWCERCERPVNLDTCLVEVGDECICQDCLETKIERLMTLAKDMDTGYADEDTGPYDTTTEKDL